MVTVSVKHNIDAFIKKLDRLEKQAIRAATVGFINDLAFDVKEREERVMSVYLDRPTPFTKKSLFVKKAGAMKLTASVIVKRIQAEYLKYQIHGGSHAPEKRANLTPVAYKRNAYGNIPNSFMKNALSNKKKFFSGIPKGKSGQKHAGIWERYGRASKKGGQKIRKVVNYIGTESYRPARFPFYQVGERVIALRKDVRWNRNFERALRQAGFAMR